MPLPAGRADLHRLSEDLLIIDDRIVGSAPGPAVVLVKGSRFRHTERVYIGLTGRPVACALDVCNLYINCSACPELSPQ